MTLHKRYTIALFIDQLNGNFRVKIWRGIVKKIKTAGHNVIIFPGGNLTPKLPGQSKAASSYEYQKNVIYDLARSPEIDGIIAAVNTMALLITPLELLEFIDSFNKKPVVTIGAVVKGFPAVVVDNKAGIKQGISHLINIHKARHIAFIKGPDQNFEARLRYQAYLESLQENQIEHNQDLVVAGDFSYQSGLRACEKLLARKAAFHAIVASNDYMAAGVLENLRKQNPGLYASVPVIGFDNVVEMTGQGLPLATVNHPLFEMAEKAAAVLLDSLAGKEVKPITTLPSYFISRQSCGCHSHFSFGYQAPLPISIQKTCLIEKLNQIFDRFFLFPEDKEFIICRLQIIFQLPECRENNPDQILDELIDFVVNRSINLHVLYQCLNTMYHSFAKSFLKEEDLKKITGLYIKCCEHVGYRQSENSAINEYQLWYYYSFSRFIASQFDQIKTFTQISQVLDESLPYTHLTCFSFYAYPQFIKNTIAGPWLFPVHSNCIVKYSNFHKTIKDSTIRTVETQTIFELIKEAHKPLVYIINALYNKEQQIGLLLLSHENLTFGVFHELIIETINNTLKYLNIEKENVRLKLSLKKNCTYHSTINSKNKTMQHIEMMLAKVKDSKASVLITGETGTGKEVLARYIHNSSRNREEPFVAINCASLQDTLLESELFGHEKGAFTSANARKLGLFEVAGKGTIFLDEIGDVSHSIQARLLRVLQEKTFFRVGGVELLACQCRIIAATNRDLISLIREKKFREDLFYRLNLIAVEIPPLRERREDIEQFVELFIHQANQEYHKNVVSASPQLIEKLKSYHWPGNVRQLKNEITKAVILGTDNRLENLQFLNPDQSAYSMPLEYNYQNGLNFTIESITEHYEKKIIKKALSDYQNNHTHTAKMLKITRKTLYNKIKKYNL